MVDAADAVVTKELEVDMERGTAPGELILTESGDLKLTFENGTVGTGGFDSDAAPTTFSSGSSEDMSSSFLSEDRRYSHHGQQRERGPGLSA